MTVSLHDACKMSARAGVTVFAGKAGLGCRQVQLVVDHRIGGVTAEAHPGFIVADRAANGLLEILWLPLIVSRGDGKPVDGGVIAHLAFEKLAVPLQHQSLRLRTHRPADRNANGLCAVGHGVGALACASLKRVGVGSAAEGHARMILKD